MRKGGWAAATGLGSLVLLLAACGGSSSSSDAAAGSVSSTAKASASSSSGSAAAQSTASAQASASSKAASGTTTSPQGSSSQRAAGPQPSSGTVSFPPQGTTFMIVAHTALGYVLAQANGQVVYTYAKDLKGGSPTCTGSCAANWPPVTGTPRAGPADTFPGTFGVVKGPGGVEQITYNGYPLYTLNGAKPYTAPGNSLGGAWHVIPLSAGDISA